MYFRYIPIRFECTGCAVCCTGVQSDVIVVKNQEITALAESLGVSRPWFVRRYTRRVGGGRSLRMVDGACEFLDANGRCRVYAARPLQCRTYPFWPEVLASRSAWQNEARRCEGIGRGGVVDKGRIETLLKRQTYYDEGE